LLSSMASVGQAGHFSLTLVFICELTYHMKPSANRSVKSADRALDILEYIAEAPASPSFSQLLSGLGIPRSSLFHLLNNLSARGYLVQDGPSGRYCLGGRVLQLADRVRGPSLSVIVTPFLRELSAELNETSAFYVRSGDAAEVVASVPSSQALSYTMRAGERAPLYAVSGGKIMLAHMPAEQAASYLSGIRFESITPQTITSLGRLRKEIAAIRRDGFAYSREEFTPGITGLATAILNGKRLLGALNLAVPTARLTPEQEVKFKRRMVSVATSLTSALRSVASA
jgi:IclR family transcriptional regulator, acetate operon repressor